MPTLFLTGSSGGLATAIRDQFLREEWSVAGFDRTNNKFSHTSHRFYEMNAMDEASVESAFETARNELGTPRALVATVGGIRPWKSVAEMPVEDFRFLFELNLVSFFLAAKQAFKIMSGYGSIISIGAETALHPEANKGGYVASKAGVIALTQVLAEEGKSIGINANVIVPTVIRTKANEEWGSADEIPKWTDPGDIAGMCLFLSSDAGKAVNGSVIRMPNKM